MMRRRTLLLLAMLAGCARAPLAPAPATPDLQWYHTARAAGQRIWQVDPAASLITVLVRRGGALARLGHDHVIASRTLSGWVAPDAGRADLQFRLDAMSVDETALRSQAGLDTVPSTAAIEGTRQNMLGTVLEAQRFPLVTLQVQRLARDRLRLAITLHGVTQTMELPASIVEQANTVQVSGSLSLLQSQFGITPMSVMAGALTVQDRMELQFHISAR